MELVDETLSIMDRIKDVTKTKNGLKNRIVNTLGKYYCSPMK